MGRRTATQATRRKPRLINYPRYDRRGFRRWIPSWKLVSGLFLTGLALAVGAFVFGYATTAVPDANDLVDAQTTTVYYSDGETAMGEFAAQDRTIVTGDQIPQHVKDAIIAAEDRSFYENRGISPTGIARAFWNNLRGNSTQGGSTITQQYVKNYYLEADQTYTRKIREAFIAIKIDQQLSKDQILTDYLNTIYFGRGAYGIESAAQAYFGKSVGDLTPNEAALIAGIVPSPTNWDPRNNPERAEQRYRYVLDGMAAAGHVDAATAEAPMPETVEYAPTDRYAGPQGYLLAAVRDEVLARTDLTESDLDRGGLKIVSTIDKRAQDNAVAAVQDPENFPADRPESVQAALVSLDPGSGAVRAMYGGADYLKRQRNAVTQDIAQAGSTFKPFTLVAALEQGISLKTKFNGASPKEFPGFYVDDAGNPLPVRNFGGSSYGDIDLLRATQSSVNTVYVALNEEVGPEATSDVAMRAGFAESEVMPALPSNVLGTPSVTPLDMGQAYATLAAQGVRHDPYIVESAEQGGEVVYQADPGGSERRVFSPEVMADTTFALQGVVQRGSGEYASRLGRPAAGKTGTSNDNRSAWFAGYVPQLATVVGLYNVGENGEQLEIPQIGGREVTGGSWPVRIWTSYMQTTLDGMPVVDFPPRADVGSIPASQRTPTETPTQEPTTEAPTEEPTTEEPTTEPTTQEPPQPTQQPTTPPGQEPTRPGNGGGGGTLPILPPGGDQTASP